MPGVTVPIDGAAGGVFKVSGGGLTKDPPLVAVSVTGPGAVGMIVKVWAEDELLKLSVIGVESPPPEGVIVIVPVYVVPLGVSVNDDEAALRSPPAGPVNEYAVAGTTGAAETEDEAGLIPTPFVAFTMQAYAVPSFNPLKTIGLTALMAVAAEPELAVHDAV
jgi:hypothetical protein